jgi:hypothetical protein
MGRPTAHNVCSRYPKSLPEGLRISWRFFLTGGPLSSSLTQERHTRRGIQDRCHLNRCGAATAHCNPGGLCHGRGEAEISAIKQSKANDGVVRWLAAAFLIAAATFVRLTLDAGAWISWRGGADRCYPKNRDTSSAASVSLTPPGNKRATARR